jgi:hypothetical protein
LTQSMPEFLVRARRMFEVRGDLRGEFVRRRLCKD